MTTRNKRVSDQTLIFQAIEIVREELKQAGDDPRVVAEVMERLCSLYACIDTSRVASILKQFDMRGEYGKTKA